MLYQYLQRPFVTVHFSEHNSVLIFQHHLIFNFLKLRIKKNNHDHNILKRESKAGLVLAFTIRTR